MKKTAKRHNVITLLIILLCATVMGGVMVFYNSPPDAVSADTSVTTTDSDFLFDLNSDSTGYKVRVKNRRLTSAIIPKSYNGLPVTEVSDNAFVSCANLTKVIIPETVTRVGNNAFKSCKKLKSLRGMSNVKEIGNNAFAMCTSLMNLIIPASVETMGTSIIKNVANPVYVRFSSENEIKTLNNEWDMEFYEEVIYGNEHFTCTPIENNGVITGYSLDSYQNIVDFTDKNIAFGCSYYNNEDGEYYPITEIMGDAFYGLTCNTLMVFQDKEHIQYDYKIKLNSTAFSSMDVNTVVINIGVEIDMDSTDLFLGSFLESIQFRDPIDFIPEGMFMACDSLRNIKFGNANVNEIPESVESIGNYAFNGCANIHELTILSSNLSMGDSVFELWGMDGVNQIVHFTNIAGPQAWENDWKGYHNEDSVIFDYMSVQVLLDPDGGTGGSESVDGVNYLQPMPENGLVAPTKRGYMFEGYYSQKDCGGIKYYNADMTSANKWETAGDTIYAGWKIITYSITYELDCTSDIAIDEYNNNVKQYTVKDKVSIRSIQIGVYTIRWNRNVIEESTIGSITVTGSVHVGLSVSSTLLDVEHFETITVNLPTSNFNDVCLIKVHNDIETLNVVGRAGVQYSLRISMQYHDAQNVKPYKLILNNVDMIAPAERCAITAFEDLYLYAYGVVKITGGDAPRCTSFNGDWEGYPASGDKPDISGNYAIYCKNLYIMSSQSLLIQGGSGMHGDQAYTQYRYFYGGTAASGVYVTGGNCEISCDHVTIRAGEAGDVSLYAYGCKGGNGAKAVSGENFDGVTIKGDFSDITLYDSPNKNKGGSGSNIPDPEYPPYPPYPVDPPIITV